MRKDSFDLLRNTLIHVLPLCFKPGPDPLVISFLQTLILFLVKLNDVKS